MSDVRKIMIITFSVIVMINPVFNQTIAKNRVVPDEQDNPVVHHKTVRVGIYENKPKVFTDESGKPCGIFIDILQDIAYQENWELEYIPCEWSASFKALEDGIIDLMPDVAYSKEREKILDFHETKVIESWSQIYANKNNHIKIFADLNNKNVAMLEGSIQQTLLGKMLKGFGCNVNIVSTHSYNEAFRLAATGKVDAVVSNHLYGGYYYQKYGLQKTSIVFNTVSLFYATAKGRNSDLLTAIDRYLPAMKAKPGSVYYQSLAKWMEKTPNASLPFYVIWIIGGVGGLAVIAFIIIIVLQRLVTVKTKHLLKVNETLFKSEEKFRNLFQNHMAVKLIIDPDDGCIVDANDAAARFYGWSVKELCAMNISAINLLSNKEIFEEIEKAKTMKRIHFEFQHQLADGSIRDVEVFSSRIDYQGKEMLHSIIHDITEHRKLEEQYRQAQKMETIGRLAGGVAHDFNNMLSVILGYTELAMEKVGPKDPLHCNLSEILKAVKRSSDITRQLLAFARKQSIAPKVMDINHVVAGMIKMLRRLIGEDIELVWLPEKNLLPIKIDPSQIEQILVNLCVNARDAINGVGKVTIETHVVTFEKEMQEQNTSGVKHYVLLVVSDNGCGMSKETLEHIFEPFYTTKEVNRGTGLGLAMIYGIVKQNDGFINVYSEPGIGTTFRICLPSHSGEPEKTDQHDFAEISLGSKERVLIVEDDIAIREMTSSMLQKLNYTVLTAELPDKALELARDYSKHIDLLITDVVMPGMNGGELADKMALIFPDMKILYMSGYTADVIAKHGVLDSGINFVQKPFTIKDLSTKIRQILDGETNQ